MKRVTRLIGPRRAAKAVKPKEATSYNAFVSLPQKSTPSGAAAPIARVHNYGRGKALSAAATGSSLPSSSAGKIQYAALNRMRKNRSADNPPSQRPRSTKWRRLLGACWWRRRRRRPRSYKDYWGSGKPKRSLCCCRWGRARAKAYSCDSDEEDDDIDAKVAAYIVEMKQREAVASQQSEKVKDTQFQESSIRLPQQQQRQPHPQLRKVSLRDKPRAWTWDDSLRSNSDRFLETLEEELPVVAAVAVPGGRMSLILPRRTPLHVHFVESEQQDNQEKEREAVQGRRHSSLPAACTLHCFPRLQLHFVPS
ncbi:Hypothetical predicted protein [Drosophila guanche]|uniref:Uncharacterized protein n=1 Tax=Drosophila guanche TaxID=7266 RepID=A0A3B0K185_DROGU|nr:Hypothetical predicted protein [Drosophila guanche]